MAGGIFLFVYSFFIETKWLGAGSRQLLVSIEVPVLCKSQLNTSCKFIDHLAQWSAVSAALFKRLKIIYKHILRNVISLFNTLHQDKISLTSRLADIHTGRL